MPNASQDAVTPRQGGLMKFTFQSGARPLDGYTIKRGVGRGGFGEVYYGVSDGGKDVALKLVRRNLEIELRGIRHCLNLKHPNLLALYDIRTDAQDDTWVLMEFVSGESLEQLLERHPDGLPIGEALRWFHGIAAGVAYLHDHGIVHRDLKPANVFLDEGIVKVGDYGLSKFISCSRRSGQTESVGTVHYMAPEVANGRYGKEIDIYALGVLLYELITGRLPFEGESIGEILMKHLTAEPDLARLPERYRLAVARALEKDPERRVSSVPELLALLPGEGAARPEYAATATVAATATQPPRAPVQPAAAHTASVPHAGNGHGPRTPVPAAPVGFRGPFPNETKQAARGHAEDPLARALRHVAGEFRQAWGGANPGARVLLVAGLLALLIFSIGVWLPLLFVLAICYTFYFLGRVVYLSVRPSRIEVVEEPVVASVSKPPPAARPAPRNRGWFAPTQWHQTSTLVHRSRRERLTELLGSMLGSAVVALAACAVTALWYGGRIGADTPLNQWLWLTVVCTLGAWAVLVPTKTWESSPGEPLMRRFVLMALGVAVGAAGFFLQRALFVELHPEHIPSSGMVRHWSPKLIQPDGAPTLALYCAFFGSLFGLIRWWRQAVPGRRSRLKLTSAVVCALIAYLLGCFAWPFPMPWGAIAAGIISFSVQVAAPWRAGKGA